MPKLVNSRCKRITMLGVLVRRMSSCAVILLLSFSIANSHAVAKSNCTLQTFSTAELTPEFETNNGISDAYKSPSLRALHSNRTSTNQNFSDNKTFSSFKTNATRTIQQLLTSHSLSDSLKQVEYGDVRMVFWPITNPYFDENFWMPKYVERFFEGLSNEERTLDSPWIKAKLNKHNCHLTVLVIWNVRQFITDSAILGGVDGVASGLITPNNDTSDFLPSAYMDEVVGLGHFKNNLTLSERQVLLSKIIDSQHARELAAKGTFPAELFWWYASVVTNVGKTDTGSFSYLLAQKQSELTPQSSAALLENTAAILGAFLRSDILHLKINDVSEIDAFTKQKN
jgi:hypothetical protein